MKYAIFQSGGKQYKVSEGQTVLVDHIIDESQKDLFFSDVLLLANDGDIIVGTPFILGASVNATVLGNVKEEKIRVAKFKAKSRYRRVMGFRKQLTKLHITAILASGQTNPKTLKGSLASSKQGKTASVKSKPSSRRKTA